jgi:hypothetical protein
MHMPRVILAFVVLSLSVQGCAERRSEDAVRVEDAAKTGAGKPAACDSPELVRIAGECIQAKPDSLQVAQLMVDALCIAMNSRQRCAPVTFPSRGDGAPAVVALAILEHLAGAAPEDLWVQANSAAVAGLGGNLDDAIGRLDLAIPRTDYAAGAYSDIVVCSLRASEKERYPLYLVQPPVSGIKPMTTRIEPGQGVWFDDDGCIVFGSVEPEFALLRGATAPAERFSAAAKAGFGFISQGGEAFTVKQPMQIGSRQGKLRWYMEANLSILSRVSGAQ